MVAIRSILLHADYEVVAMELTFPSSLEELVILPFNLSILDDTIVESTEQIEVFLNISQNGVLTRADTSVATVSIFSDDSKYYLDLLCTLNQILGNGLQNLVCA